jgi:hypothetical protein
LKANQQDHNALVDEVNKKANAENVYTKGETYSRQEIADLIADITGGESAADVLAALTTYKGENDERVANVENRIKTLEEAVDALEAFTGIGGTTGSSLTDRVAALETWQGTMNTWKESISSTVADNT